MGAIRPLPGLPSLPSPCSGLGYCLSTFLHHLQTALRNEECGYSSRIHLLARAQEIRAQLPQGADQHPCSIFLTGCKSTVCDHGQGQGSCPQLGAHRPCSQYDSCNEYPRNKPQPWSIFPPWVIWATIHMNPSNRITLAFLPKLWRIRQQGKDPSEGTYSPAHLQFSTQEWGYSTMLTFFPALPHVHTGGENSHALQVEQLPVLRPCVTSHYMH